MFDILGLTKLQEMKFALLEVAATPQLHHSLGCHALNLRQPVCISSIGWQRSENAAAQIGLQAHMLIRSTAFRQWYITYFVVHSHLLYLMSSQLTTSCAKPCLSRRLGAVDQAC